MSTEEDPYEPDLLPVFPLEDFDAELIRSVCLEEVEKAFKDLKYENLKKDRIITSLTSDILTKIAPDGKGDFKYVTHCTITPKRAGPIDIFSNNFWDPMNDGMSVVNYENDDISVVFIIWGIKIKKPKL
ncbi:Tctex-1 family protein [Trichomonas vaginalis G3]|uniref:Tctex-1 family protein n=1 Tax=Trichomonas vaginalis (strain ATCC PRA-98 / G3) TaxID=412133 RepID=A2FAX9_TRIV3|nr:dynein light chain tctex-type family [Trichomonas vaginalis G3]EAX97956.1 Tctex-1 family protein [Trichomonas vaginalis G3]KAI5502553.1 dynein light chain tctex-type family [Trichomonas vaginalis G3]|eukprot:XP_001310886.1 Tctex-1 family protein [Trichomonas vaginalis G3]